MSDIHDVLEHATNPPTPERPMGGPDGDNQPPPPPPETDPKQDYNDEHAGIPRPQTNDANRPGEELRAGETPDDPAAHGVRRSALDSA